MMRNQWFFFIRIGLRLLLLGACLVWMPPTAILHASNVSKDIHTDPALNLTEEELRWLKGHSEIRIGAMEAWPPMNFVDESGRPDGIGADYIKALNQRLGNVFKIVPGPFAGNLEQVKTRKLDALMDVTPKPEREKYLNFTGSYLNIPHVIIAPREGPYYKDENDLDGKILALEKGFGNVAYFREKFPGVNIREYANTSLALGAVVRREADAYAGNRAVAAYIMEQEIMATLEFQGRLKKPGSILAIGVRKDWPELAAILDKALLSIPGNEIRDIRRKWTGLDLKPEASPRVRLTPEEFAWIQNHPVIRVSNAQDYPPFDFVENGRPAGFSIDYLNLVAIRTGLRFEYVQNTWALLIKMGMEKKIDVLHTTFHSPDRETSFLFTKPYKSVVNAIFVREGIRGVQSIRDLANKKVILPKGDAIARFLPDLVPEAVFEFTDSYEAILKAVSLGWADATVLDTAVANYLIRKNTLTNIRSVAEADIPLKDRDPQYRIAVRKDWPLLHSIVQKAMDTIEREDMAKLEAKWFGYAKTIRETRNIPESLGPGSDMETPVSYNGFILGGICVLLVICSMAFILIKSLKRENIAIRFGSSWFRGLVLAGLSLFVLITASAGWWIMERNKAQHLKDVGEHLKGILSVGQQRLDLWLEGRLLLMARLGRDPELVAITKRLLRVEPSKDSLLKSEALRKARVFFIESWSLFPHLGFFIINPDHISIGAMANAQMGAGNPISDKYPHILHKALQGKTGFVPPILLNVHAGDSSQADGFEKPSTMFFVGPVQDMDGSVIGAVALRVDPWKDLAKAMEVFGSMGTGETYAFDQNGLMLSSSRFEDQLRKLGLLQNNRGSALNIEIRDPGVNMAEGGRPDLDRSLQPLTHMASRALELRRQIQKKGVRLDSPIELDLKGYRDYRGVPVFGAWRWSADFDMGLAVEIDVKEALASYYQTRTTVYCILGFTLLLSSAAILFVLIVGERTSLALKRAGKNLEKKVAERTAQLKENQDRFVSLLESAPDAMVVCNESGEIVLVNSQTEKLFGYDRSQLLGNTVDILVPEAKRTTHPANRERYMADAAVQGKARDGLELTAQSKTGVLIPVDITLSPIESPSGLLVVASIRDITQRKQMEQALSEEKKRLQKILDTSPVGVAFASKDKIHFANPKFREMFGAGVGDSAPDFYVNPKERKHLMDQLAIHGKVENCDLKMYDKNHEIRDMLITYLPISHEGANGVLGWLLDITDRKKVEREIKEKYDELNRFMRLAVGREEKMIELKKEINELLIKIGIPMKYKIHA